MPLEFVLKRLAETGCGDRSADERNADWLEWLRRQRFRRIACPETVSIARYGDETFDALIAHEVVQLRALGINAAEIAPAKTRISRTGPGLGEPSRKDLRIGAPVERPVRRRPYFPGRFRCRERALEPRLLFATQQRHGGFVLAEVRHFRVTESNRIGWLAIVVPTTGIQHFHRFLREKVREVIRTEGVRAGLAARVFHRIAVVVGDDEIDVLAITHRAIARHAA